MATPLVHFRSVLLPNEPAGGPFFAADGQHGSVIQPSVWPAPPALSPYPDASEGTGLLETDLLDCWPWQLDPVNWMNKQELPILR